MSMTTPDGTSADMEQLRRRHQDLLRDNLSKPIPSADCQKFIEQLVNSGRDVAPGRDRDALRKMLYFWTAEAVSRGDRSRDEALPTLAAYSGGERSAANQESSVLNAPYVAEDVEATADARAVIRIAALARQWQVAGKDPGYLLTDTALEEARKYKDKDFEITAFIEASEAAAASTKALLWRVRFSALAVLTIILGGGIWYLWNLNEELQDLNERLAADTRLARDALAIASGRDSQKTRDDALAAIVALNGTGPDPLDPLKALLRRLANVPGNELERLKIEPPEPSKGPANVTSLQNKVAPVGVEQRAIAPTEDSVCRGVLWLGNESDRLITNSGSYANLKKGDTITVRDGSSVRLRKGMPSESYVMSPQIGLVPGGASLILTGKPETHRSVSNPSAQDQYFAPVSAPQQYCTRVYVQYAGNDNKAREVRAHLLGLSFQVPPVQEIRSADKAEEVRVYWKEDLKMADLVASTLASFNEGKPLAVRQLYNYPNRPPQGTLEVWLDLSR
jgi:hypothetical protein